jgi:toluene monooxygenase system protein D
MSSGNRVGPVLRSGEIASAAVEAVQQDNPGKEIIITDHIAYVRVATDRECVIRRDTMEQMLGRPFRMQEIETDLSSFAGQINLTEDFVRFYLEKTL